MSIRTLLGWGSQTWGFLQQLAGDLTCAWAGYDGFHVGTCPSEAPPYSHLWAWNTTGDLLLRVRIDGDQAIVGALIPNGGSVPHTTDPPKLSEQVRVREERLLTWPPGFERIGEQPSTVLPGTIRGLVVQSPTPITFIRG